MARTAVPPTDRAMAPVHSSPPSMAYVATVASPVQPAAIRPVRAAEPGQPVLLRLLGLGHGPEVASRNGPTLWTRISGAASVVISSRLISCPARAC